MSKLNQFLILIGFCVLITSSGFLDNRSKNPQIEISLKIENSTLKQNIEAFNKYHICDYVYSGGQRIPFEIYLDFYLPTDGSETGKSIASFEDLKGEYYQTSEYICKKNGQYDESDNSIFKNVKYFCDFGPNNFEKKIENNAENIQIKIEELSENFKDFKNSCKEFLSTNKNYTDLLKSEFDISFAPQIVESVNDSLEKIKNAKLPKCGIAFNSIGNEFIEKFIIKDYDKLKDDLITNNNPIDTYIDLKDDPNKVEYFKVYYEQDLKYLDYLDGVKHCILHVNDQSKLSVILYVNNMISELRNLI